MTVAKGFPGKRGVVDRFEGDQVVLEVEGHEEVRPRASLAAGAREGDWVNLATGEVDEAATEAAREKLKTLQEGAKGSGDFDL